MKKAFKIGFIYLGVILLALLATTVFCAAFLFFYRDGNIFGIKYISAKDTMFVKQERDISDIKTIDVTSSDFDVSIVVDKNVKTVVGAMHVEMFGYAFESKAHAKFEMNYNDITKTAAFTSKEPQGWLNRKGSYISISIPDEWVDNYCNIIVKTGKGDIVVGNNLTLKTNNLSIESVKGDADIVNTTINNSINLNCGKGLFYIDDKCSTTSEIYALLGVNSGKINLSQVNTEKFKIGSVEIIKNKKGLIGIKNAIDILTSQNINGGGEIQIGEVDCIDFKSLDTDVKIVKINSTSRIGLTGVGDVYVKECYGQLDIEGYNGSIKIDTITKPLIVSSNQGNIKVSDAFTLVSAESKYGNIDITFNNNAGEYDSTTESRAVNATTKDGHITVNGLQKGLVNATGSGRISLYYNKVVKDNEINAGSGAVYIVVPQPGSAASNDYALNLSVSSNVGADVKVGVGGDIEYDSTSNVQNYTNIYNSGATTSNNLVITSTTGKIKVRSSDLTGY